MIVRYRIDFRKIFLGLVIVSVGYELMGGEGNNCRVLLSIKFVKEVELSILYEFYFCKWCIFFCREFLGKV